MVLLLIGGKLGASFFSQSRSVVASHADILRGSSHVPARDEPVRTSAWEASSVVDAKPITLRTHMKTALKTINCYLSQLKYKQHTHTMIIIAPFARKLSHQKALFRNVRVDHLSFERGMGW